MKVYTYSQARQNLAEVLDEAKSEAVLIRRRNGEMFRLTLEQRKSSPLDVGSIKTKATTDDILRAIREVREREG